MICVHSFNKIFGWTFDGLQITVQRYHCEDLYAAGRAEEATEALLKILNTFDEEIHASKETAEWVMSGYRHTNQVGANNMYFRSQNKMCRDARSARGHGARLWAARRGNCMVHLWIVSLSFKPNRRSCETE